jgi:Major capsid protein Gp23
MSVIKKLTEGVVKRDLEKEGGALMSKWADTGLLEGMGDDRTKATMARLLENQAQELLREANTMSGGDVEGFAAVAFPIVRRVFGSLIANELVSVQPMSLPSGLIFFLDFQFERDRGANLSGSSLFGGGVVGSQLTGGVSLSGPNAENSLRALNQGYSLPTGSGNVTASAVTAASGTFGAGGTLDKLCKFDADFVSGTTNVAVFTVPVSQLTTLDKSSLIAINVTVPSGSLVRRLTAKTDATGLVDVGGDTYTHVRLVVASLDGSVNAANLATNAGSRAATWPIADVIGNVGTSIGAVVASQVTFEGEANIPEIDIKVDSVAVTAKSRKLKAKWTPELGQDLNAYHNLDAEVELTSILSEQIGLEIDQEMLGELVKGATAATLYWSRRPGKFVERTTGLAIANGVTDVNGADFTGNVSMWYETLVETINDVSAAIHRKTLRGGANFVVCGPEVANILEFTTGFRANVVHDDAKGTIGAVKAGSLSKKWDVFVDPYFPRNLILVGRKGSSFLESGFVYAPYVPLQVTPTIFGTEDFVPRKGVMTRYAKKMVRPDMYGLVVVQDLLG